MSEPLHASAQYDDWVGSAAVDDNVDNRLGSYLRDNGLIDDEDFVVGFDIFFTEMGAQISIFTIEAQSADAAAVIIRDSDPVSVKRTHLDMTLEDFVGKFNRFSIACGRKNLDIHGKQLDWQD